jgi:tetratricopeptide (TPR) repeat protein
VNLRDCPPFASLPASNVSPADQAKVGILLGQAELEQTNGNFSAAEKLYDQADQIDPQDANLQFSWGKCLLAEKDFTNARIHLQLACDVDALPFRTDSRLNREIQQAAEKYSKAGVSFFDANDYLARQNPDNLCGTETFFEHVHFDFLGSYELGLAWARQLEKAMPQAAARQPDWLSKTECEDSLGLSDWNRMAILKEMLGRMGVPPFSSQAGNDRREQGFQARIRALQSMMTTNDANVARQNFELQIAREPEDYELAENYGLFLQATGDIPESIKAWEHVHDLLPQDFLPYYQMGRFLSREGQTMEAVQDLRKAVQIHPSLTDGWYELGNVLAVQQKFSEALDSYAVARKQRPQDAQIVFRMGKVYELLHEPPQAMECYHAAVGLDGGDWQLHYELGGILDAANDLNGSLKEFGTAVRLKPDYSRAHFNYGVALAKSGRLEEAKGEFTESLRLEPGYRNAEDALYKVELLLQQQPGN